MKVVVKDGMDSWSMESGVSVRSATSKEINAAFEKARKSLDRPMTWQEIQAMDTALAEKKERGSVPTSKGEPK